MGCPPDGGQGAGRRLTRSRHAPDDDDHGGPDRRGDGEGGRAEPPGHPGRAGPDGAGLRGHRGQRRARAHPGRRDPPDARPRPADGDGRGAARGDRPGRAAVHRRRGHRPRGRPAARAGRPRRTRPAARWARSTSAGRVPQPLGVHRRAAHARCGTARSSRSTRSSTSASSPPCSGCSTSTARRTAATCTATSSWACLAGCRAPRTRWPPRCRRCRAEGATFSATGVGRTTIPVMLAVAVRRRAPAGRHGGHAHVRPGEPVRDNAQLVARAAGLARIAQRPPASPVETREVLGIRSA